MIQWTLHVSGLTDYAFNQWQALFIDYIKNKYKKKYNFFFYYYFRVDCPRTESGPIRICFQDTGRLVFQCCLVSLHMDRVQYTKTQVYMHTVL